MGVLESHHLGLIHEHSVGFVHLKVMTQKEFLYVEKYRPQTIEDTILPAGIKSTFQEFVKQELSPGGSWLPFPTSLISVQDIDTRRNDYRALQEKVGIKKWQDHR